MSEEDSEIVLEVPTGDTVLGRGPLLKVLADQTLAIPVSIYHFGGVAFSYRLQTRGCLGTTPHWNGEMGTSDFAL